MNLDYNKMYFKAGEGYVLLTYEDIEINMTGETEERAKRRVLTLHNATVDLRGTEADVIFENDDDLKVVFEGENNLYCNEKSCYGLYLNSSGWESDMLILSGKENAILNIYGYGADHASNGYHYAIGAGILVVESGEVNVIEDAEGLNLAVTVYTRLYVNEGARFTITGGFLRSGELLKEEQIAAGKKPINAAGELNAVLMDIEVSSTETKYIYNVDLTVYGDAIYTDNLDVRPFFEGEDEVEIEIELNLTLTIPEGTTLTVP